MGKRDKKSGGLCSCKLSAQTKETTDLALSQTKALHSHAAPSPHLFLSAFLFSVLFVEDGAVDSRCLTHQPGCLVTWIYNS